MNKKQTLALLLAIFVIAGSLTACSQPVSRSSNTVFSDAEVEKLSAQERIPAEISLMEISKRNPEPSSPRLENMMGTIDALCGKPRPLGSREEYLAAQFLHGRLKEYGYQSQYETFAYNITQNTLWERYQQARNLTGEALLSAVLPGEYADGESRNVIGRQPGEADKKTILVLSAHYDSTPDSIGVVDNASGVSVVLEAARILASEDLPFALRIVLFGGEEEILIGSRQHLLGMKPDEPDRIIGNISVDTLAYTAREEFVALTPLLLPQEDAPTLAKASPVAAAFLADPRVTPAFRSELVGDFMSFSAAGIDSVNFGQSMDEVRDRINSPKDTYDLLVPELLPTAVQLLVDAVCELATRAV